MAGPPVVVLRSARRKRTVSADIRDGSIVVSIPAHFTVAQERKWVARMVAKLESKFGIGTSAEHGGGSAGLHERALALARTYLDGDGLPCTIEWVTNQNSRWGSATPARRSIRLSHKLQGMPEWVVDYVILHEMAHLIESSHSPAFWRLLESYPHTATAKAYLAGASFAADRGLSGR